MNNLRVPSRWNYAFAALILLVGAGVVGYLLFTAFRSMQSNLQQVTVPGRSDVILSKPGHYTIFHEHRSTFQNRVFNTGELPGLQTALVRKDTGLEIPLKPSAMSSTYTFGGREGSSVLSFDIDQAGIYEFRAWYPDGSGPEAVFAIGHGFVKGLFKTIGGVCGVMLVAFIVSLTIVVSTAILRSRGRQVARAVS